jgi:hypothetical protein
MSDSLKDAMDLDTWQEHKGYVSVHCPLCPHCRAELKWDELNTAPVTDPYRPRPGRCSSCNNPFYWHHMITPLGPGWQTWQTDPTAKQEVHP